MLSCKFYFITVVCDGFYFMQLQVEEQKYLWAKPAFSYLFIIIQFMGSFC